jgi:hypothetical protein
LIFRDEPTETLVRKRYGEQLSLLNDVTKRLRDSQDYSIYAARALPGLLLAMGRVAELRALAFDTRFPPELDSEIAKRAIRLNRLKTALGAAAKSRDFDGAICSWNYLRSRSLTDGDRIIYSKTPIWLSRLEILNLCAAYLKSATPGRERATRDWR